MSELKKINQVTPEEIKAKGVSALATHPNRVSQYGKSGLSAAELKAHFDALGVLVAGRLNELSRALSSSDATEYVALPSGYHEDYTTLKDVISALVSGGAAEDIIKLYPDEAKQTSKEGIKTLQEIVNDFAKLISENAGKFIEEVKLIDSNKKIQFVFKNHDSIELDVSTLLNPVWKNEIDESDTPPTSAAVNTLGKFLSNKIDAEERTRTKADEELKLMLDTKSQNSLYHDVLELGRKTQNLEAAANGKLYDTVEESGVEYTTQLPDVLPYGILSRIGGLVRWEGDYEESYSGNQDLFTGGFEYLGIDEIAVVSNASEIQIESYNDLQDGNGEYYSIIANYVIPTNQKIKLSDLSVVYEDSRDGSTSIGVHTGWGVTTYINCTEPCKVVYGNLKPIPIAVKSVAIGLPYTLDGAKTYSGTSCTVKGNTVVMPKGSQLGILIPCALPKGTKVTVTANGENSAGEKVNKFAFRTSNSSASAEIPKGGTVTLTADSTYLMIYKYNANTALAEDLEISDIKIVVSNPDSATLYTSPSVSIPDDLITYLNDNGYAYGVGLSETCYNYLDLTARTYHQYCKVENDVVVELANPITVDVSEYLAVESDVVLLQPYCMVRFINEEGASNAVPYTVSYKKKIGG